MIRSDATLAYTALLDAPAFAEPRIPTDALDFGDSQTIMLSLKRRKTNIFAGDPNDKFGVFLGKNKEKFVVGVHNIGNKFQFNASEAFESLEEMKAEWQLD